MTQVVPPNGPHRALQHDRMPTTVFRDDVQRLVRAGAQLIEVLPRDEYEDEHLPGAINIPLRDLDREAPARLRPDRPVIVYCWDFL